MACCYMLIQRLEMSTQPKPIPMTTGSNTLSPSTESDTRSFNYKQSGKNYNLCEKLEDLVWSNLANQLSSLLH